MKRNQMKTTSGLLVVGLMAAFCCSTGTAQTIYYSDFTSGASGVSIEGTAPTMANDFAGGSSGALWNVVSNNASFGAYMNQDGTVGRMQNSVLLPFTPESGHIYNLEATLTFTSDPANWLALGFAAHNPADSTTPRFNDSAVNGNPWSLFRPGTGNGGVQLFYSRTGLAASAGAALIPTTYPNTDTISIMLDTTGANWVISEYANGTLVQGLTYTYSSNPGIVAVGLGQNTLPTDANAAGHQWLSLSLAVVPEPSAPALMSAALAMMYLVTFYRRPKR